MSSVTLKAKLKEGIDFIPILDVGEFYISDKTLSKNDDTLIVDEDIAQRLVEKYPLIFTLIERQNIDPKTEQENQEDDLPKNETSYSKKSLQQAMKSKYST